MSQETRAGGRVGKETLVLYHQGCADGFGAAWAAHRRLGDTADYRPCQHGQEPPDVRGYDCVYVLDFTFPRAVLEHWHQDRDVQVLDHHRTAAANLRGLPYARFDMAQSGAMLAWAWFHPYDPAPALIEYVQDRDLWRWALPQSREVSAAIWSYPMTFPAWNGLAADLDQDPAGLVLEGAAILRYMQGQVARICAQAYGSARWQTCGVLAPIPIVNATSLWSEVGEELLRRFPDAPFVASYAERADGQRAWSLRGRAGYDVSALAAAHGGGGHAAAAGYTEPVELPR